MEMIKDKNGRDLTEAEYIKKRWKKYTEELYQEVLDVLDIPDSVIKATNMNLTKFREAVEDRRTWHAVVHGVTKSQTRITVMTKQQQPGW